jgi:GTP-binding protein
MSKMTTLAIVGRPNVGKSALFNRICQKKIAIVDEAEGVTRDRIYSKADLFGFPFEVIDTGGINARSPALFNEEIKRQAEIAIEEADTLVMVVDGHVGVTDLDLELARTLLKTKKPVCLAVNKIDDLHQEPLMHQFYSLGISSVISVSATQNWHIAELLEAALNKFRRPDSEIDIPESTTIHIAIVGRPNVGKSSLINYILDDERCIVSPIPGTTRDSIDVSVVHNGQNYTFIDTAGIRRKRAEHEVVDKFAFIRTEQAIKRADLCLLMLDAQEGMTTQEKKIANMIEEAGKGCIILFNKWDLVKGFRMEHCIQGIEEEVPFLHHCPKVFISAKTGRNVEKIFPLAQQVNTDSKKRITTHQLNKFVGAAMQKNHPPMLMGKRLRIYYMAQVGIEPPKFVFFVNFPNLMADSYRKYLYNQFREEYGFVGVPILFYLKGKKRVNVEHDKAKADAKDEEEFSHPETDEEAFDEEPEDFVDFDDEE